MYDIYQPVASIAVDSSRERLRSVQLLGKMDLKEEWTQRLPGLERKQCRKAAAALLRHLKKQKKESPPTLFDEERRIWLAVRFNNCPQVNFSKGSPYSLPVVHSIHENTPEVCLFIPGGPQDNMKKPFKEKLVPGCIQKVVTDNALKRKYVDHEAKRELMQQFDLFLASQSMVADLPRLLGKPFCKSNRFPALVQLNKSNKDAWENRINAKKMCTFWYPSPGVKTAVRIGLESFDENQIVENLFAVLSSLCALLPDGFSEILRVSIRGPDTTLLPVYQRLPGLPGQGKSDADLNASHKNNRVGGRAKLKDVTLGPPAVGEDEQDMEMRKRADQILKQIMSRGKWDVHHGLKRPRKRSKTKESTDASHAEDGNPEPKRLKKAN